jgi:hypothetical protein
MLLQVPVTPEGGHLAGITIRNQGCCILRELRWYVDRPLSGSQLSEHGDVARMMEDPRMYIKAMRIQK